MNPISYVWFWVAVVAIIAIIVAYSFSEGVGQSSGNNTTTPMWVWILWGLGILLLIVAFILYCIAASRAYKAKLIEEACNPKPKKEEIIQCPVKKSCGCAIEVNCSCARQVTHGHNHGHSHFTAAAQPSVQVSPIQYAYPDTKPLPVTQPHLYYEGASSMNYAFPEERLGTSTLPVTVEDGMINVRDTVAPPKVYTAFPQAPGYSLSTS